MIDAEPPQVVLEQPESCSDGDRATRALERALAPSRAPAPGWRVVLHVERVAGELRGEGEVTDASGALVAARTIKRQSRECGALARAMGVWASLVLDDELSRAQIADQKKAKPEPPPPAPAPATTPPRKSADWGDGRDPGDDEKPSPEAATFLVHDPDNRTFEIGASSQLMAGTGAGMIAAVSAFTVSEVANGWFLRPALSFGRTATEIAAAGALAATWGAGRFDACKRLPGNYLDRRGIQLDLCGGADVGFLDYDAPIGAGSAGSNHTSPFLAVGPSMALRGELGSNLSLWIRGIAELNVVPENESGWVIGRAEVGVSWRVR